MCIRQKLDRIQREKDDFRKKNIDMIRKESSNYIDHIIKDACKNRDYLREQSILQEKRLKEELESWKESNNNMASGIILRKEEILGEFLTRFCEFHSIYPTGGVLGGSKL